MKVNVTQEDIDQHQVHGGWRGDSCPIAQSLRRTFGLNREDVHVLYTEFGMKKHIYSGWWSGKTRLKAWYKLPQVAIDFIARYDKNDPLIKVAPFEFEIEGING